MAAKLLQWQGLPEKFTFLFSSRRWMVGCNILSQNILICLFSIEPFFFLIGAQLLYNVVLVSAVQHSELAICTHIYQRRQ